MNPNKQRLEDQASATGLEPSKPIIIDQLAKDGIVFSSVEDLKKPPVIGPDTVVINAEDIAFGGLHYNPQQLNDSFKVDKKFVHKEQEINVLISHPISVDGEMRYFRSKLLYTCEHPFFFEHPLSHLPGLLLIEAIRQIGTAVSHLYFCVPLDTHFILKDAHMNFLNLAPLSSSYNVELDVHVKKIRKGYPREITGIGTVMQEDKVICSMKSDWTILPKKLMSQLEIYATNIC